MSNRYEIQARRVLTKTLVPFIPDPAMLQDAVDVLMGELLWWPQRPSALEQCPICRQRRFDRDGACKVCEDRTRATLTWGWAETPSFARLLLQARGGRAGVSFRLTKYQDGGEKRKKSLMLKRVKFLVDAECASNGGNIAKACGKLADPDSDPTLYPLKVETLRKYYSEAAKSSDSS